MIASSQLLKTIVSGSISRKIDVVISNIKIDDKNKIVGDIDFDNVSKKCSYITPVLGGVEPMTVAFLMKNTYLAMIRQKRLTSNI